MTPRLFGKLPAHGDFVARGCSLEDRTALDGWLTGSLADAQVRFGPAFADRFDAALPWRGEGEGSVALITASQDAAGRRYPLVLFASMVDENMLFAAIADRWDADRLFATLPVGPAAPIDRWSDADGGRSLAGPQPPGIVVAMLESAGA